MSPIRDEGQWIRVQPRKGKLPRRAAANGQAFGTPPNPAPQLQLDQIVRDHDRISAGWRESPCYRKLRDLVSAGARSHAPITKAICLAIGSFDPISEFYAQKRIAHIQLEAFRVIVDLLETQNNSTIVRLVQEPAFTPTDKAFCESLGFRVLETPAAFDMIDSRTLVYGIHLYLPVWSDALEKQLPGCCVGTPFEVCETYRHIHGSSFELAQVQAMDTSFDKFDFPRDGPSDFTFSDTAIYWARS